MRPTRIPLPRFNVDPRHLYRHLLREASYLPPICAAYISARIKSQFRKHQGPKIHAEARMSNGLRKLRHLHAANSGDVQRLYEVFLESYGRKGHLRRHLVSSLVQPDAPESSESSESSDAPKPLKYPPNPKTEKMKVIYEKARSDTKLNRSFIDWWDFEKLQAYLQSQIAHSNDVSPAIWPGYRPAKAHPLNKIPETNIWGHPLPLREMRARLKQWWRQNITKLEPPLGASEWETLRDLATKPELGDLLRPPPRRPVAAPVQEGAESTGETWHWQPYASLPTVQVEKERERGFQESVDGTPYDAVPSCERRVSNRKLRRAARKVFEASSYIKRDASTAETQFVWGTLTPDLPVADPKASSFFEGLDHTGTTPGSHPKTSVPGEGRRARRKAAEREEQERQSQA